MVQLCSKKEFDEEQYILFPHRFAGFTCIKSWRSQEILLEYYVHWKGIFYLAGWSIDGEAENQNGIVVKFSRIYRPIMTMWSTYILHLFGQSCHMVMSFWLEYQTDWFRSRSRFSTILEHISVYRFPQATKMTNKTSTVWRQWQAYLVCAFKVMTLFFKLQWHTVW